MNTAACCLVIGSFGQNWVGVHPEVMPNSNSFWMYGNAEEVGGTSSKEGVEGYG